VGATTPGCNGLIGCVAVVVGECNTCCTLWTTGGFGAAPCGTSYATTSAVELPTKIAVAVPAARRCTKIVRRMPVLSFMPWKIVTTAPAPQQIEKLRDLSVFISALIATATGGGNLSLSGIIRSAMSSNPDNRFVLSRASLYTPLLEAGADPEQRQQILEELIMVADDQPSRTVDSVVMLAASQKTQSVAPLLADLNEMLANQLSTYETAYRNFVLSDISNARVMLAMALVMVVGIAIYTAPTYAAHAVASLVVQVLIAVALAFLIMIVGSARRPFIVKSWFV